MKCIYYNLIKFKKETSYQAKTFDNMIFGYKTLTDNVYETQFIPNIGNDEMECYTLSTVDKRTKF